MTKSKSFWAGLALMSLAAMVFAGYSIYERITLHFSGDTIEVHPVPMLPPQEEEEEEPPADSAVKTDKAEEKKPEEPKTAAASAQAAQAAQEPVRVKAVKTAFEYKDSKAKSVAIAGSFTSWKDREMKKKDGVWKADIYILPGTYPYHFIVDGKKKTAAGKPKAPSGDSLVTVE